MLVRYVPGATSPAERLRRCLRAVLYLPTRARLTLCPETPWINAGAAAWLKRFLTPDMRGFEYGSGRSTLFLARRLAHLTSVEHKEKWRRKVAAMLEERGLGNATLLYLPPGPAEPSPLRPDIWRQSGFVSPKPEFTAYCDAILEAPEASLDVVLIDGRARVECAFNALARIRPGGALVLDNSEWEKYAPIFAATTGWTRRDFENGVWRTSVLVKPGARP